jgi:hypothetical protein
VKLQLIEQFHANRANKFMEINTEQHVELVKGRKRERDRELQGEQSTEERCETEADARRDRNKWTRDTGRSVSSTRVSTAQPRQRYYRCNVPALMSEEVDERLLQQIKRSTYR